MSTIKKILVVAACFHSSASVAEDYFNPLFLGSDIASIADLNYLNQGNDFAPGNYFLDFYVGDHFIQNMSIRFYQNSETKKVIPCFTKEIVELLPLKNGALKKFDLDNKSADECINIEINLPDSSYKPDITTSSLKISIPQIFLSATYSTLAPEKEWDNGIATYLMNYNFRGSYSKNKDSDNYQSYFLNIDNKITWDAWRLNASGYWNQSKVGSRSSSQFKTTGIYLSRSFAPIKSDLIVGQSSLGSNLFDTMYYIGAGLSRSGEMLAESEKGYSPPIMGIVDSRSKITIKQNSVIIYETYVEPGPYNITDINPIGSSGDYQVEVTAANGVVTTYTVPYSTITDMLTEGNFDYAVTVGKLDESDTHERAFLQSTFSYGLPNRITAYMGVQLSQKYKAFGLGFARDFGDFGAVSIDAVSSQGRLDDGAYKTGQSYKALYSKNFATTGTGFQLTGYRYSTPGYYSFTEAAAKGTYFDSKKGQYVNRNLYGRRKSTFQLNVTQTLGKFGQLYAWGNKTDYWGTGKSTNLQFGWSKSFDILTGLTVNATFNKYKYNRQKDNSFYLSFSLPLSSHPGNYNAYLTNSTTYNTTSHNTYNNTSIYGSAFDNKLSYGINESLSNHSGTNVTTLNADYNADIAKLSVGTSIDSNTKQFDYGIAGGVVLHSGGVVFSREVRDTAVLVEAKGAKGARVSRQGDNIVIGNDGYALIPYVQPYRYNDVELDPGSFSDSFDVQNKVQKTVPTRGAITKVTFEVLAGYNFLIELDYQGQPVPFGAQIINDKNSSVAIANDDGTVFLTGVEDESSFTVRLSGNSSCSFKVNYGEDFVPNMINRRTITCL